MAATTAAAFCAQLPLAKIDAIVGASVALDETVAKGKELGCVYTGIPGNMSIETQTDMPASTVSSVSAAEQGTKEQFPSNVKLKFATVTGLGPVAFTWAANDDGVIYGGLNDYKGSTGYFAEMGGALKTGDLEKLVKLALAAK